MGGGAAGALSCRKGQPMSCRKGQSVSPGPGHSRRQDPELCQSPAWSCRAQQDQAGGQARKGNITPHTALHIVPSPHWAGFCVKHQWSEKMMIFMFKREALESHSEPGVQQSSTLCLVGDSNPNLI